MPRGGRKCCARGHLLGKCRGDTLTPGRATPSLRRGSPSTAREAKCHPGRGSRSRSIILSNAQGLSERHFGSGQIRALQRDARPVERPLHSKSGPLDIFSGGPYSFFRWSGSVAVSISACHAEGRGFKSRPDRQQDERGALGSSLVFLFVWLPQRNKKCLPSKEALAKV
ncbi:hypothetical protein DR_0253 [Deinococcus radiodurans R1 = ATCC 13939 = DSM 20539]|uniref:Uncharacterized protein n=1 Tax=Deinococcus radiodurans (strain ATCC 13939 / DSM 20539 / JCM 16871 / CCUG 27074 / LMG 4051 / NBRC 15346 / NCIMB 9279 / VKM B-1422 / R1) TaxID=243230 RepID=Q9RXQ5_DEIRA|nr:hypothetical protein DR_0253 [Deinococcus radiodurans R1 = ATCC 13939 = DSM 20539]